MKSIRPSKISGSVRAPASKSMMLRAVAAAALAQGASRISNPSFCDDALAAMRCARALGAKVRIGKGAIRVTGIGGKAPGNRPISLDCGESGLCMRMFPPIAALFPAEGRIFGKGSLLKRKVGMMEAPLRALGASCSTKNGKPPITVRGPLHSGSITIDGSESSQFLTGLLLALTICKGNSVIRVGNLKSKPYVRMTVSLQRKFGVRIKSDSRLSRFAIPGSQNYRAHSLSIEGDWSGAAFLLVAGAIAGKVHVSGLTRKSSQADKAVLSALKSAGAKVKVGKDSVIVSSAPLQAFKFNASDCPDLFPPLAVLACNCEGTSVISGAKRLAGKESDRAAALQAELGKMGAKLRVKGDLMFIKGRMSNRRGPHKGAARTSPLPLRGGTVDSHNDHRIAMACAIAALNSQKGVRISGEKCVSKSYPQFFRDLKSLQVYR